MSEGVGIISPVGIERLRAGKGATIHPMNADRHPESAIVTLYAAPVPAQDDDKLRIAVEALEPFAAVLVDIGESEDDADCFRNPSRDYAKSQGISVGHIRRAATVFAALKSTAAQEGGSK